VPRDVADNRTRPGPVSPYLRTKWCSAAKRRCPDTISTTLLVGTQGKLVAMKICQR